MPLQAHKAVFALYALVALVASVVDASPKVFGLDFRKETPRNTPQTNRLRRRQKTVSADITNGQIAYLINMTVGSPPQPFSVQLDTGSSDIWIPATVSDVCQEDREACQAFGAFDASRSSTFKDLGPGFQISYEDNSAISGDYINDTLAIGNNVIKQMTMGLATQASRALGIMGIGYDADESIATTAPDEIYPNIIAQLQAQGFINTLAYSLWLNDQGSSTGSILFGGVDTAKYKGNLVVLPVQPSSNSSSSDVSYTDFTVALSSVSLVDAAGKTAFSQANIALPVILDSGTTDTYLPDSVVNPILNGVGAINDPAFGTIVPCSLSASPATFSFGFGGTNGISITVPFSEFVNIIYLEDGKQPTFKNHGGTVCGFGLQSSGTGPILFGDTFLRSAYVVYDLSNNQIGMAQTNFNATSSNIVEISGTSLPGASATATAVAVTQTYTGVPQETDAATKSAGSGAQVTGTYGTPTFNLGVKGAAAAVAPPRIETMGFIAGLVVVMSLVFGGSMVTML